MTTSAEPDEIEKAFAEHMHNCVPGVLRAHMSKHHFAAGWQAAMESMESKFGSCDCPTPSNVYNNVCGRCPMPLNGDTND